MTDLEKPRSRPYSAIYSHKKFIILITFSGYGLKWSDPEGEIIYLPSDAPAHELGKALIITLSASRIFTLENRPSYTRRQLTEWYNVWVGDVMKRYGFKTRRAMFAPMKNVSADQYYNQLELIPSIHEKLEGWGRTMGDGIENVFLPYPNDPEVIGDAIRLALSRCR